MKTMEDIRRRGFEALARELGPVGMARFQQLFENGSGDYVQERHERHDQEAAISQKIAPIQADKVKTTGNA